MVEAALFRGSTRGVSIGFEDAGISKQNRPFSPQLLRINLRLS